MTTFLQRKISSWQLSVVSFGHCFFYQITFPCDFSHQKGKISRKYNNFDSQNDLEKKGEESEGAHVHKISQRRYLDKKKYIY